jgi:hypothetical protein
MIGVQLYALLSANAGVAALVGDRIFPQVMPQGGQLPALVYAVVDDVPENTLTGYTLRGARVQIDCYGKAYIAAQGTADAVVSALAEIVTEGLAAVLLSRRDGYEDETTLHKVMLDFSLWIGA